MYFAKLNVPAQNRVSVQKFLGYDAGMRTADGAFRAMKNLCSDGYPSLTVRPKRGTVGRVTEPHGMLGKDCLLWVDGQTLYMNGVAVNLTLSRTDKQLISMGAYVLIWPDRLYLNTKDITDCGSIENTTTPAGEVSFSLCRADGTALGNFSVSDTAPSDPAEGALWRNGEQLWEYDGATWQEVGGICTKIEATGIGTGFSVGDGVVISGCTAAAVNGTFVLTDCSANALIIPGCPATVGTQTGGIMVRRYVPDMDFVIECGNRLWGCKYGMVNGEAVNEIYASALGDFRNWNTYAGLSTDSYAAQRGSNGAFTGAVSYLGSPIFFKENCMERVYVSGTGAHQITTLQCSGVKSGSSRSLCIVEGVLYYHGVDGIYAFEGSMPQKISHALGSVRYSHAVAGSRDSKYYVAMEDSVNGHHVFVWDTLRRLWHREDDLNVKWFTCCDHDLYAMTATDIVSMGGSAGTEEDDVTWYAETGDLGLNTPEGKYLQRLEISLQPEENAQAAVFVSYDGGKMWTPQGSPITSGRRSVLHVRPHRCKRLRLKISGTGGCTVYGATAVYEKGSDGP